LFIKVFSTILVLMTKKQKRNNKRKVQDLMKIGLEISEIQTQISQPKNLNQNLRQKNNLET